MKVLNRADAERFWQFFNKEHYSLRSKFPDNANVSLVNEAIAIFRPTKMSNEDFAQYETILNKWLSDNGFK
jgi:hypothetical protein